MACEDVASLACIEAMKTLDDAHIALDQAEAAGDASDAAVNAAAVTEAKAALNNAQANKDMACEDVASLACTEATNTLDEARNALSQAKAAGEAGGVGAASIDVNTTRDATSTSNKGASAAGGVIGALLIIGVGVFVAWLYLTKRRKDGVHEPTQSANITVNVCHETELPTVQIPAAAVTDARLQSHATVPNNPDIRRGTVWNNDAAVESGGDATDGYSENNAVLVSMKEIQGMVASHNDGDYSNDAIYEPDAPNNNGGYVGVMEMSARSSTRNNNASRSAALPLMGSGSGDSPQATSNGAPGVVQNNVNNALTANSDAGGEKHADGGYLEVPARADDAHKLQPWFVGDATAGECKQRVKVASKGSFLVRTSKSKAGSFAVCVNLGNNHEQEFLAVCETNGRLKLKFCEHDFETIDELVVYWQHTLLKPKKDQGSLKLTHAASSTAPLTTERPMSYTAALNTYERGNNHADSRAAYGTAAAGGEAVYDLGNSPAGGHAAYEYGAAGVQAVYDLGNSPAGGLAACYTADPGTGAGDAVYAFASSTAVDVTCDTADPGTGARDAVYAFASSTAVGGRVGHAPTTHTEEGDEDGGIIARSARNPSVHLALDDDGGGGPCFRQTSDV
jgi:hypothetical protein